jgi:hypothetical protein
MKWSDDDLATLKRLAGESHSSGEIAKAMGRPRGSVCWHAKRHNIPLKGGRGIVRNAECRKNRGYRG